MADVKPIRTEKDYEAALARVDELMDAELGSPEGDELDVLVDLDTEIRVAEFLEQEGQLVHVG